MALEQFYLVDFPVLKDMLTPVFLRKPKMLAFLKVLVKPVVYLHETLLAFRTECLYKLDHNSQVVYLRAAINDSFDNVDRRIIIANVTIEQPVWVYEPLDDQPVYVYETLNDQPVYLRESFEFFGGGNDFIVKVPLDLQPIDLAAQNAYIIKMRGQVDYYKLFSKNYEITFI